MSVDMRHNLHRRLLIAALVVFAQELSSRGRAQAWTYNYNTGENQTWDEARLWCQKHFTNMVAIRNQEETEFLNNLLPNNSRYYWIGIRKVAGLWTWQENKKSVPEEAQNWATSEPDNFPGQDCVEIYIKRTRDTAKWNNEKCRRKKGTVCYSVSCRQDSCSAHADCVETVGNYTCKCHPGFFSPSCEAIACKPLADPAHGSQHCSHPFGSNRFNSSCLFSCELGFRLVGESQLLCQASGHWNQPVPLCQAKQCPVLNHTSFSGGGMNCSHPIAHHSYNSTCEFSCDEGYELIGEDRMHCDHSGQWTASIPACTVKKCPTIFPPVSGNVTCVDAVEPFSFGSQCNFTCQDGFYPTGDDTLACLASGQWSKPTPTCTVVQCSSLKAPLHAHMQCEDPVSEYSYGSTCTVRCEDGFDVIGANMTKCSSQGNWSHALPDCKAKRCNPVKSPPHGSLSCSNPHGSFSFGSRCTAACDEGFLLNGTSSFECTSLGMWSADMPSCLAKRCPTLNSTAHGALFCSDPHGNFSFGSRCSSACEEGFLLNGTADTECTSSGTWSTDVPHCLAKTCPPLSSPSHGSISCSHPNGEFSFRSRCTTACEEGFFLNGTADTECTSSGTWSTEVPHCLAKRCSTLTSPPHGSLICSKPHGEFSFGSQCTTTCEEGFLLNGTADTECTTAGTWSNNIPQCSANTCPTLSSPSHGSLICSGPHGEFSFGSRCTSTCEEGFLLTGMEDTNCTSVGRWSREMPRCQARQCPLLAEAPQHGRMNCSHPNSPFSYGSVCDFECNEGFWLGGTPTMTCNTSGIWSQNLPTCQPVQCETIRALPLSLSMNCSHPLGNFSFGSQCVFTCNEGFSMNGTSMLVCSSAGFWNDKLPSCTGVSMGTARLMYTGVGASSVALILVLIGVALLAVMRFRKRGDPILSEDTAWDETENPAFEF